MAFLLTLCPPSGYSLASLLVLFGLSEIKYPDESQRLNKLLECVRGMIEIGFDEYNGDETNAVKISVRSQSAQFSANLANQVVEKYFQWQENKRKQKVKSIQEYLAQTILLRRVN